MVIYNVLIVIGVVLTILFSFNQSFNLVFRRKKINIQRAFACFFILALTAVSSMRAVSVGTDTGNYINRYENLGRTSWDGLIALSDYYSFEYGFSSMCKLLYDIAMDYRAFLIFTAIWTGVLFFIAINKYSKFPILSVLIFYCWGLWGASMNIVRQMMVIPILYIAIGAAREKNFKKFFILITFSSFFHLSSIIFLPIYFLINVKINLKIIIITAIVSLSMPIIGIKILQYLLGWTSFGWYFYAHRSTSGLNTLLLIITIIIVSYVFRKQLLKIDYDANVWMLFMLISMLSTSVGMIVGIFERVTKIFITSVIFLFPDIYIVCKKNGIGTVALLLLLSLLVYYFYLVAMVTPIASSYIIPYSTWLK